jgi:hypothetical protein
MTTTQGPSGAWERISQLEALISRPVDRNIEPLARAASGGLRRAAQSRIETRQALVVVATGMFIPGGRPAAAETDGPVGSAELAVGLSRAGIEVRVLTDELCKGAVVAALRAASGGDRMPALDLVPIVRGGTLSDLETLYQRIGVTHVIAVERIGAAADGRCYDMRGADITSYNGPIDLLYQRGSWTRIGIGDGGNEIGMGALSPTLIATAIDQGARIACAVSCDHLIVAGVSNWGAQALLVALAMLAPPHADALLSVLSPALDRYVMAQTVGLGPAVDGVTGQQELSVDGLNARDHGTMLRSMLALVASQSGRSHPFVNT